MSYKTCRVSLYCFIIIFCSSVAYAALYNTPYVEVNASIGHQSGTEPWLFQNIAPYSDTGPWTATIDSGETVAGHNVYTSHSISFDSPEEVTASFDRRLSRTSNTYTIGQNTKSWFFYEATIDSVVDYSYYLNYFFIGSSSIEGGNVKLAVSRWDVSDSKWISFYSVGFGAYDGPDGIHQGSGTFSLSEGNKYKVSMNTSSSLLQTKTLATLAGDVSFNFNGATVPIPSAVWLLGSGLIGIVGIRRKFKK